MSKQNNMVTLVAVSAAMLILAGCSSPTAAPVPPTTAPTKAASAPTAAASAMTPMSMGEIMKPNCGSGKCDQPGAAITQNLKGDAAAGQKLFADNCVKCHGDRGAKGIDNPGSNDGTVPVLNPIDSQMGKGNPMVFATSIDLFIEHGSTPDGPSPKNVMDSWGDKKLFTPQQIADLIAYVMSLNP